MIYVFTFTQQVQDFFEKPILADNWFVVNQLAETAGWKVGEDMSLAVHSLRLLN